jgi:hypothetical protein
MGIGGNAPCGREDEGPEENTGMLPQGQGRRGRISGSPGGSRYELGEDSNRADAESQAHSATNLRNPCSI